MRLKGIILTVITLSAAMWITSFPARAEELFDGVYTEENFTFSEEEGVRLDVEVPDGDYTVTVKTGGETETDADIYINGGERVSKYTLAAGETKDNVQPAVPKDGKISFQIIGENPNVTEITVKQLEAREKADKPTIYIAGDSTAQTFSYISAYPRSGWGQVFNRFFTDEIIIDNRAMGGRSAKSFNNDGRLDAILTEMHPGDYVFIQFGINDATKENPERYISVEDYKKIIAEKYIGEVNKRGGTPVLMTASASAVWDEENGVFEESRQEYANPTRELAKELGCKFIDANRLTTDKWNSMNKDDVLLGYFICEPLESKEYPEGIVETNHFKDGGATAVAGIIAGAIPECVPELKQYLKGEETFVDVAGHWAEKTINFLAERNVVRGTGKGKFDPDSSVTRAEFLKMAMDAAGIPGHAYREGECLDAENGDWFCYYVQSALDKGLLPPYMIEGGNTYHRETKTLTEASDEREAVTVEIYKYDAKKITLDGEEREAEQKFNANTPITREEMAAIVMSCIGYKTRNTDGTAAATDSTVDFTDKADVDAHYEQAVATAYACGYISGTDEGKFMPKETLTRAEAAVVIYNIIEAGNKTEEQNYTE